MERRPWVARKFQLGLPPAAFADVLERVRGTPARLEDRARGLTPYQLTRRHQGAWSIQDNIGHLLDLETLWETRLDELMAGDSDLTGADMTNRKTDEAAHNEREIGELLTQFRTARETIANRLDAMTGIDVRRTALHPRLQQPMSMVDLCFFVAEHDDHHLASITQVLQIAGELS